ncbi:MAG: hypothetical protein NC355_05955 [Blautia sp.]|nr:hypothetical protein [Blautia sp.]
MIYLAFLVAMYTLALLLRLHWITALLLTLYGLMVLPKHCRLYQGMLLQRKRFTEAAEYLDTLLYAFSKEEKVDIALENVEAAMHGSMQRVVRDSLDHLRMTYDDTDVMRESLRRIEEAYPCARIATVHDFVVHVENYGGRIERAVDLLLSDKKRWEKRILLAMKERSKMFTDIIMSIAASLIICGIILYMPVMDMDISKNVICQALTAVMLVLDERILLRAQKMMAPDWLLMDLDSDPKDKKRMEDYKNYCAAKEQRLSLVFALPCILGAGAAFRFGKSVLTAGLLALSLLMLNQHRLGHGLAGRNLRKSIQCAFPTWLLDIVLLLQSENVQMSMRKSVEHVPAVLESELLLLNDRLELEPEAAEPYHAFLQDFEIPEVHAAMSMLFSISMGHSLQADRQLSELIDRNLAMLDAAEKERLANLSSGMYLLFLAPVLTASFKLVVDMAVFMLSFITGVGI